MLSLYKAQFAMIVLWTFPLAFQSYQQVTTFIQEKTNWVFTICHWYKPINHFFSRRWTELLPTQSIRCEQSLCGRFLATNMLVLTLYFFFVSIFSKLHGVCLLLDHSVYMIRCLSDIERLEPIYVKSRTVHFYSTADNEFATINNSTSSLHNFVMSLLNNMI